MELIALDIVDRVATLTLQSDDKNTITHPFLDQLKSHMDSALHSDARCLLIQSSNPKFFSNGFHPDVFLDQPAEEKSGIMRKLVKLGMEQFLFPLPTVCAVSGYAAGGGAFIAAYCDFRFMSAQKARIGFTEVQLAMTIPSAALELLNHRLGLQNTLKCILPGDMLGSEDCLRLGLVDEICADAESTRSRAADQARKLAALPRESLISLKKGALSHLDTSHFGARIEEDMKEIERLMATPDCESAFAALKEGRRPRYQ